MKCVKEEYFHQTAEDVVAHMEESMEVESETILRLIFGHYDKAVLLLCRSAGSRRLQRVGEYCDYYITGNRE